mgnify:CR=1 FL=1
MCEAAHRSMRATFDIHEAVGGVTLDDAFSLPARVAQGVCMWRDELLRCPKTLVRDLSRSAVAEVYCDASRTGWGGVAVVGEVISIVGGRWEEEEKGTSINVREMLAVRNVWRALGEKIKRKPVALYIDNVTAIVTLRRTYSPAESVNNAYERVRAALGNMGIDVVTVTYVATKENPADAPSRADGFASFSLRGGWEAQRPSHSAVRRVVEAGLRAAAGDGETAIPPR